MRNRSLVLGLVALIGACSSMDGSTGGGGGSGGGGSAGGGGSGGGVGSGGSPSSNPDMAKGSSSPGADMASGSSTGGDLGAPSDLASTDETTKFLGTWSYGAGSMATTDCPGQMPRDLSTYTFTVSLKSGKTITFSAGSAINCSFDFTVAGTTATLVPNQSCTTTVSGTSVTVTPDSGTMITADGVTGSLMAHANVDGGLCTMSLGAPSAKKM
jgi:hypothetical protein